MGKFIIRSITVLPKPSKCLVYRSDGYMFVPDYILAIAYEIDGNQAIGIYPEEYICGEEPMNISENSFDGFEMLTSKNIIEEWKIIKFIEEQSKFDNINNVIAEVKEIIDNSGLKYNPDFDCVFTKEDFEHYKNKYK